MANELVIHYPTGATLYVLLSDATGQVYNGSTFEAPGSASWATYGIAMTEAATATGIYRASMPAVAAGVYGWTVRKQAGGSPAVSDATVGVGEIRWTGTAEETVPASANVTLWKGADADTAIVGADGDTLETLAVVEGSAARICGTLRTGREDSFRLEFADYVGKRAKKGKLLPKRWVITAVEAV